MAYRVTLRDLYKNQYRIIYRILEDQKEVEIWGIGKRESGKVYRMVSGRIERESSKAARLGVFIP